MPRDRGDRAVFCPKCKAEYREGVITCADCGVPLVDSLPGEPEHRDIEFVDIVRTFSPQDIAIIKSILDGSGIEYYIQGDHTINVRPFADPAIVYVVKEQADEAIELLKDLDLSFYVFRPDRPGDDGIDGESSK
jgi:hypothetical protein